MRPTRLIPALAAAALLAACGGTVTAPEVGRAPVEARLDETLPGTTNQASGQLGSGARTGEGSTATGGTTTPPTTTSSTEG